MLALKQTKNVSAEQQKVRQFLKRASDVILNKEREIKLAFCCLLARGHVLIEDVPGMGKTTLVKTFAKLLGLNFSRIQCTNDLLPSDILGVSIYNEQTRAFEFIKGPIFSQLILGDELNRATPKSQSACLQAMEEMQVSIDGVTYPLPEPFFFAATQNYQESIGTFPLPDSQLDRFTMRISLGAPSREAQKELLGGMSRAKMLDEMPSCLSAADVIGLQQQVENVHVSNDVLEYLLDITETAQNIAFGFSTRASLKLLSATKAWAFIAGRDYATPDDVQAVLIPVLNHRLRPRDGDVVSGETLANMVLRSLTVR